jgi:hypothetical protein
MRMVKQVYVKCWCGTQLLATYPLGVVGSAVSPPILPDRDELITHAKTNLANDGLAGPPYDGIRFEIVP